MDCKVEGGELYCYVNTVRGESKKGEKVAVAREGDYNINNSNNETAKSTVVC